MSLDNLYLPEELQYSREHLWVKKDVDGAVIGVDDYARMQLKEVLYVDLPDVGSSWEQGQEFGTVESVKSVSPLIMPVKGKIIAVNSRLDNNPGLINSDCYGDAWIIRIKTNDFRDINGLMNADKYRSYLGSL